MAHLVLFVRLRGRLLLVTSVTVVTLSFMGVDWLHPEFSFQLKGPPEANIKYPPSMGSGLLTSLYIISQYLLNFLQLENKEHL